MSDQPKEEQSAGDAHTKPAGSIVPWIAVGVLSAGLGSALPFLLAGPQTQAAGDSDSLEEHGGAANHNAGGVSASKRARPFTTPKEEDTIFLPFGEPGKDQSVVVNLDEGRMSRYLRVAITLQIPKSQEVNFKKQIEAKKVVLRNWLLSKISDLPLDDIRGAAGQNKLRREIREQFNAVLCPDGDC